MRGYAHAYNVILVCVLFTNIDRGYSVDIDLMSSTVGDYIHFFSIKSVLRDLICTSFRALVWHACLDLFVRNFLVLACLSNLVVPSVVEQYGGGGV